MNMRFLCTALAAVTLAASLLAQGQLSRKVDVVLQDASLEAAVRALGEQTGMNFVIRPSDAYGRISLTLKDTTAEQAIKYIAEAAGAYAVQDEGGVWILRPGSAPAQSGGTTVSPDLSPILKRPVVIERIAANHLGADYLLFLLKKSEGQFRNSDWDDMFNFGNQILGFSNQGMQAPPKPDTIVGMGQPVYNGRDAISLPTEGANQGIPGGGGGGGGQGGGGNFGGGGGQGGQGGGGNFDLGLEGGTGLVPEGIDRVVWDPATNSLLVFGTADAISELRGVIERLDVAPRQVLIKLEFVTTSRSLETSLGIDWLYTRGTIFAGNRPGSFARTSDPVFINYSTGNVATRLRTFLSEGNGRVVSAPIVRTLENQPAFLFSQVQTTIFSATTSNGPGGITTTFNPIPITSSTFINVKPRVNGDGTITMYLTPQVSEFGEIRRSPDGTEIPDLLNQGLAVVTTVKDGETIALGGLTRKQDRVSTSRTPLLSDLPIIGRLFRGQNKSYNTQELIIFVTPKIVAADENGLGGP